MSKIQDLKGTHNVLAGILKDGKVVSDVKDTRFERNSQRGESNIYESGRCFWCQRYKIWKELTTYGEEKQTGKTLFLMSKIQDLKGTHNLVWHHFCCYSVVSDVKDTRFERNSQRNLYTLFPKSVVSDVKDTRFERNSQPRGLPRLPGPGCLWCQRYKIWKELTTCLLGFRFRKRLSLMSKIQDLKSTVQNFV